MRKYLDIQKYNRNNFKKKKNKFTKYKNKKTSLL